MVSRLKLVLDEPEYSALLKEALTELRSPDDQARYIVRQELMRKGLLPSNQQLISTNEVHHGEAIPIRS